MGGIGLALGLGDLLQSGFGQLQQPLAMWRSSRAGSAFAAQTVAQLGVVWINDLYHLAFIKELGGDEFSSNRSRICWVGQRDGPEPFRVLDLLIVGLRDHAPIPDKNQLLDPVALLDFADLVGHGAGILGVARKDLYPHGQPSWLQIKPMTICSCLRLPSRL